DGDVVEEQQLAESYLASAPICGRKAELTRVKLALEQVARGRGVSLVINGPSGVGRTRFLSEVALRAKLRGCMAVHVDASEHESPYGIALALVEQLARLRRAAIARSAAEHVQSHPAQMAALARLAPQLMPELGLSAPDA